MRSAGTLPSDTKSLPTTARARDETDTGSMPAEALGGGGFFGDAYCKFLQNVVKYISLKNIRFFGRQFMRFSFPP